LSTADILYSRFLLNQGLLEDVLKTIAAIRAVTGTPPPGQRGSDIISSTYYLEWRVFAQRGEGQNALDSAIKLREISNTMTFSSVPPYQGASYLIAMSYITKGDYTNGLAWIGQCNNAWRMNVSVPPNTQRETIPLPPVMKSLEGWAWLLSNDLEKAKALLESALDDIKQANPADPEELETIEV